MHFSWESADIVWNVITITPLPPCVLHESRSDFVLMHILRVRLYISPSKKKNFLYSPVLSCKNVNCKYEQNFIVSLQSTLLALITNGICLLFMYDKTLHPKSKRFVHTQCQWTGIYCDGSKFLPSLPTAEIMAGYLEICITLYNSRLFPVYWSKRPKRCGCVPELGTGFFTWSGLISHLVLRKWLG